MSHLVPPSSCKIGSPKKGDTYGRVEPQPIKLDFIIWVLKWPRGTLEREASHPLRSEMAGGEAEYNITPSPPLGDRAVDPDLRVGPTKGCYMALILFQVAVWVHIDRSRSDPKSA